MNTIERSYPPRDGLRLWRLRQVTAFKCSRCGEGKLSRLIASDKSEAHLYCNGCYGELVSEQNLVRWPIEVRDEGFGVVDGATSDRRE